MLTSTFGRANAGIALIALALGYIVCYLSKETKGQLKKIGYVIGTVIIVASALIILTKALWLINRASHKMCSMSSISMPISGMPKK